MKSFYVKSCWFVLSDTFLCGHLVWSSFRSCLFLDSCTLKFMEIGTMGDLKSHHLHMLNIKIQVDKKPGSWIWISPDGSHGPSRWATSQTGRSIFNSRKSRKVHAQSGAKSCVVWFSCGIFNLQPLPAERSKTLQEKSVKMWQWLLVNGFKLINEQKQLMKQVHYISIILIIK